MDAFGMSSFSFAMRACGTSFIYPSSLFKKGQVYFYIWQRFGAVD
jgi:hypothetical protein